MRRKLPIITVFVFLNLSCSPYKGFQKITNINVEASPARNINLELDTTDIRIRRIWSNLGNDEKKALRNKIKEARIERVKDIQADTSNVTRVYLSGNEDHVIFHGKYKTDLTNLSEKYEEVDFYFESMDSIYNKIEIGTLDRNTGTNKVKIIYPELKRFAILDLDTKYSSIHLCTSSIKPKLETESLKDERINEATPSIPDTIEIVNEEGIYIFYEIPRRKRS